MKLNQYLFGKGKMEYYKYVQAANQWCMGATQIHAHPGSDAMQHASKRILPSVLLVALLLTGCGKVDISWTEDVALQDGTLLVVKRGAQGKKLGEIGGSGGWETTQMTLEIESPNESPYLVRALGAHAAGLRRPGQGMVRGGYLLHLH
jgi:orotidine-5'-phosphate decarboxylase